MGRREGLFAFFSAKPALPDTAFAERNATTRNPQPASEMRNYGIFKPSFASKPNGLTVATVVCFLLVWLGAYAAVTQAQTLRSLSQGSPLLHPEQSSPTRSHSTADLTGFAQYAAVPWLRDDASLRDLVFVDADRGWAVGDRGTILHTLNGGDHWDYQQSGTLAPLFAVDFADASTGVVVGGYYEPDTLISRGVALLTRDGGVTWRRLEVDLPCLRDVRVHLDGTIVVAGDYSLVHGSAILVSYNGGRSWNAVVTQQTTRIQQLAGDGKSELQVIGSDGVVERFDSVKQPASMVLSAAGLRALSLSATSARLATGNQLTISVDRGRTWSREVTVPGKTQFHHCAVSADTLGSDNSATIWLAGVPGNEVVRVQPDGTTTRGDTPITSPLHAITAHGTQRAWAVGAFGTILASRDGGQSWRIQRGGSFHAAVMVIAQSPEDIPWMLVGRESLERGRRVVIGVPEMPPPADPCLPDPWSHLRQLAAGLGAGEVFSWSPDGLGDASKHCAAQAAISAYQPRVLVLSEGIARSTRRAWTDQAIRHEVTRVLEPTEPSYSEWNLNERALLPNSGVLQSDLQADVLALWPGIPQRWPPSSFRRTHDATLPLGKPIQDLMDGFVRSNGQETRKMDRGSSRRSLQILQARGSEDAMIGRMIADGDRQGSYVQRLRLVLRQTPSENRGRLARKILRSCQHADQPHLYRQTLQVTAESMPRSSLGRWASFQLTVIEQSEPWRKLTQARLDAKPSAAMIQQAVRLSPFDSDSKPQTSRLAAVATGDVSPLRPAVTAQQAAASAAESSGSLTQSSKAATDLVWNFDPRIVIAEKNPARLSQPEKFRSRGDGVLTQVISNPHLKIWKPFFQSSAENTLAIARVTQRPFLDGRLDDACWETPPWQTPSGYSLRLAYDSQHLYFSVQGPSFPSTISGPAEVGHRSRDADLTNEHRFLLRLDTTGHLASAFCLETDRWGRTRDSCDGFTAWHPTWYVDVHEVDNVWTLEAAIRRDDLTELPPVQQSTWNVQGMLLKPGQEVYPAVMPTAENWRAAQFR